MNDGLLDVQMAVSANGANFTRLSTSPVVPRGLGQRNPLTGIYDSPGSEWDAGVTFMATGVRQSGSACLFLCAKICP